MSQFIVILKKKKVGNWVSMDKISIEIISRVAHCILMALCVYACANCMQNAWFRPMHVIEAKLCRHLVFQTSFRNIQQQKSYRSFLGDQSELWPSILPFFASFCKKNSSTPTDVDFILQMQYSIFWSMAQLALVTAVRTCKLCIPVYLGQVMAKPKHCMHFITCNK